MTGPGPQPVAEVVSVFSQTITLTDEQIKALPTTPIEIVPAPGVGKALMPVVAVLIAKFSLGYTNVDAAGVILIGWPGFYPAYVMFLNAAEFNVSSATALLSSGNVVWRCDSRQEVAVEDPASSAELVPVDQELAVIENQAFELQADNLAGDFTNGHANNTLEVTVFYTIIDV